jgi:hypothetical protein
MTASDNEGNNKTAGFLIRDFWGKAKHLRYKCTRCSEKARIT